MCYVKANMTRLKAQNPDLCPSETMRKVSEEWRMLTDEQRRVYQLMAEEDKQRSESQKKDACGDYVKKGSIGMTTSFMQFLKRNREAILQANPQFQQKQVVARAGELWRGLNFEDRQAYKDLAKEDFIVKKLLRQGCDINQTTIGESHEETTNFIAGVLSRSLKLMYKSKSKPLSFS